jgi:uncharacterized membrane protein YphA (DoxX/SURF4 family)
MKDFYRIGTFGLIALVALRVGIGWHFFKEGADKLQTGSFSSAGFLGNAEGRMSGVFRSLVWDNDGSIRMDQELMKGHFESVVDKAASHFSFNQEQIKKLQQQEKIAQNKLDEVYSEHRLAIYKYDQGAGRVKKMQQQAVWTEVSSLRAQKQQIAKDRLAAIWPALESIEAIWAHFEQSVNAIASPEQLSSSGKFYFTRPGEGLISSRNIDRIIPVFDLTIGILLIIGLLVPLAGWLGALFLIGVVLSQFPGDPNTQPTYYQAIEALALIVLATIGAGRFAGLDFFGWSIYQNRKAARANKAAAE